MIIQCSSCGLSVKKNATMVRKFGGKGYCNRKCFADSMKKPKVERICEQCGQHFEAYPSSVKYHGARFCTKECKDAFNHGDKSYKWIEKPTLTCNNCTVTFKIDKWRLKESSRGQFCTRECRYEYCTGDKSSNWRGGITPVNVKIRSSKEMRLWRMAVLERDDYTCVQCGSTEQLEADHIMRFSDYPELRFAIDNGRTLCKTCHQKTSTYGASKRNSKGQFSRN